MLQIIMPIFRPSAEIIYLPTEWRSNYSNHLTGCAIIPDQASHLIPLAPDKGGYPQPPSPQASK